MNDLQRTQDEIAREIAFEVHTGQFRRDGKTPYILHLLEVANRVKSFGEDFSAVAFLHDVLEDTDFTSEQLLSLGVTLKNVRSVERLTKTVGLDYVDYLQQLKQDNVARTVKIADMISNLQDNPTEKQGKKYSQGLAILLDLIPQTA